KRGARGASYYSKDEQHHVAGYPVKVVDPTGAGDCFGATFVSLYAISLIVVFLCLAALYESWSIPFSVMLVVPLGVIGALLAAT
ncbi:efflux RND transporter permease subunit, partial [Salmonella enterica subsp. enterica serovar Montevideo]|nr:efflux RND transporter permease subunit [Salmonella enterica subsp. enterica serovar Montevideo]